MMRLIFKTSSVTPDFFYVFYLILSFSTCSESFEKICAWELLGANVFKTISPLKLRLFKKEDHFTSTHGGRLQLNSLNRFEGKPKLTATSLAFGKFSASLISISSEEICHVKGREGCPASSVCHRNYRVMVSETRVKVSVTGVRTRLFI